MSVNAMNWAGLCRVAGAGAAARAVLDAVAWYAADHGDPNAAAAWPPVEIPEGRAACWRSTRELAERAEVDISTVKRVLKRFADAGLVATQRRGRHVDGVPMRTANAILLDLTAEPVVIARDENVSETRRKLGRLGAERAAQIRREKAEASQVPAAPDSDEWLPAPVPDEVLVAPDLQVSGPEHPAQASRMPGATFVASAETPAGTGAPSSPMSGPQHRGRVAVSHQVLQDTTYDRRQDTPLLSREPGTALALGITAVDEAPGAPCYRPVDEADAVKRAAAIAEFGNRYDRRLPPAKNHGWGPLRRGQLGDPAFDGMVERIYLAETAEPNDEIPQYWWRLGKSARDDVWRYVRKKMLDERNGLARSAPSPRSASGVA